MVSLRGHSLTLEQLNAPPNAGFSIAKAEVLVMTGFSISVHLTASSPFAGAPARPCRRILCPLTWNWREREKKTDSLCAWRLREMKGGGVERFSTDWEATRHASLRREAAGSARVLALALNWETAWKVFGVFLGFGSRFVSTLIQHRTHHLAYDLMWKKQRHQRNVWQHYKEIELVACEAAIYSIFNRVLPLRRQTIFWSQKPFYLKENE